AIERRLYAEGLACVYHSAHGVVCAREIGAFFTSGERERVKWRGFRGERVRLVHDAASDEMRHAQCSFLPVPISGQIPPIFHVTERADSIKRLLIRSMPMACIRPSGPATLIAAITAPAESKRGTPKQEAANSFSPSSLAIPV